MWHATPLQTAGEEAMFLEHRARTAWDGMHPPHNQIFIRHEKEQIHCPGDPNPRGLVHKRRVCHEQNTNHKVLEEQKAAKEHPPLRILAVKHAILVLVPARLLGPIPPIPEPPQSLLISDSINLGVEVAAQADKGVQAPPPVRHNLCLDCPVLAVVDKLFADIRAPNIGEAHDEAPSVLLEKERDE